ncbi:MAG: prepilin-type N-terminal cleavage/methylation domain-containing protein [Planctomycetota bacterium]|jgi:prepilin-type N-terminal cleavage/methylation domain-containing protein/prepilin-type processing-associated H-X9-DG protein
MRNRAFTLRELLVVTAVLALLLAGLTMLLRRPKGKSGYYLSCGTNLKGLGAALREYADANAKTYPTHGKWCDLLIEQTGVSAAAFFCRGAAGTPYSKGTRVSHYAINPSAERNSPGDVVLLFETKAGWNQFGGPEILSTKNHPERWSSGCNVLFNDGRVKWVKAKDTDKLNWGTKGKK